MFAKSTLLCLALLMPGVAYSDPLNLSREKNIFDETEEAGHIVWSPSSRGKVRFSYLLPKAGIDEAIEFKDTTSLFYLSRVTEQPIVGQVSSAPVGIVDIADETTRISAIWFVAPNLSLGVGAIRQGKKTNSILSGSLVVSPSSSGLTTLSVDALGETRLMFDRARLHINESSETLFYAALNDDSGSSLSLSYGRRFWDAFMGADIAWAAGFDEGRGFTSLQLERDFKETRGVLRFTLGEKAILEVGIGLEITLNRHNVVGDWTGRVMTGARRDTALDRPSLNTYRRDHMAERWRHEMTIERLSDH